ncbi:MAG: signal peptidase I [Nitrospirota bacterium]
MNKPRKPWIAAISTLLTRGLGHLYAGNLKRGLILFFIEQCLLIAFAVSVLIIVPSVAFLVFACIGSIAYVVFCAVDASLIARRKKEIYELTSYNKWYVYAGYFVVCSVLVSSFMSTGVKTYITQAYKIPSGAMMPTLLIGDHLLANKFLYRSTEPRCGDIIIFPFPEDPSRDFVKRLVAVEGDVIEIKDKRLYLNGKMQSEPYVINTDSGGTREQRDNFGPATVPPGKLFFLGDNRDYSYDSRFYGYVPRDTIKGKVISLYWSWDHDQRTVRWDRIGKPIQ